METIYILVLQLIMGIIVVEFLPTFIGGAILLLFSLGIGIITDKKSLLLWIIPILFFSRFYIVTDNLIYELDRKDITIKANIYNGRGVIDKFNGKYIRARGYITVDKIPDGEYILQGDMKSIIRKKNYLEYKLHVDTAVEIEKNYFRKRLESLIDKRIKSFSYSEKNLYKAIILGIREPIFTSTKNLFLKNGLMHILAISGLHMGIVILILKKISKKLSIQRVWRGIFTLTGLTLYYLAVNLTPSVDRAYIMGVIYILGDIFYENNSISKALGVSFIIALIINPVVYRDISFILSYWAMFCICIWTKIQSSWISYRRDSVLSKRDKRNKRNKNIKYSGWNMPKILNRLKKLKIYLLFSIYIQLSMAPLVYFIFGKFSIYTILRSIALTPLGVIYIYTSFILLLFPVAPLVRIAYWVLVKGMELF